MTSRLVTAGILVCLAITTSQQYQPGGWQLLDNYQSYDVVRKFGRILSTSTDSGSFSQVFAIYANSGYGGNAYLVIYADVSGTPCRISWSEDWSGQPLGTEGPNCSFKVYSDDDAPISPPTYPGAPRPGPVYGIKTFGKIPTFGNGSG